MTDAFIGPAYIVETTPRHLLPCNDAWCRHPGPNCDELRDNLRDRALAGVTKQLHGRKRRLIAGV